MIEKIKSRTKRTYQEADTTWTFNDGTWDYDENGRFVQKIDPGISPITVALPPCPEHNTIPGYGYAPDDQYFDFLCPKPPAKLQELIDDVVLTIEEKIKRLDDNPEYYEEEIEFILWHHKVIRDGWWFFNNGKPTYLTHDEMFYKTVWRMDGVHPEFRMRDVEVYYAYKFLCEDDDKCIGINRPKERQIGETNQACSARLRRLITTKNFKTGLQSKDEEHAKHIHDNLIYENWRKLPFYFVPIWDEEIQSVAEIRTFPPKYKKKRGHNMRALEGWLNYRNAKEKGYDGTTLNMLHNDEIGKISRDSGVNAWDRWQKQRYCLMHGGYKRGFSVNTSTVDKMELGGGEQFKKICDESHAIPPIQQSQGYKPRDANGFTVSGLYNVFIPSNEGLLIEITDEDGNKRPSIDKFGFASLTHTTQFINDELAAVKGDSDAYFKRKRERPMYWNDSFLYDVKRSPFNVKILRDRLERLATLKTKPWRRGNFYRVDPKNQDSKVDWRDDNENGRWYASVLLTKEEANKWQIVEGLRHPMNYHKYVGGVDPYRYDATDGKSLAGGAIFMKQDFGIDTEKTDVVHFQTYKWICTYSYRHRVPELFAEDMMMMHQYYGCRMAEEINVGVLNLMFQHRGYKHYLHRFFDDAGMQKEEPGISTQAKQIVEYIRILDGYIQQHGNRIDHPELIEEMLLFEANVPHPFRKFDRLTAAAIALKAAMNESMFMPQYEDENTDEAIEDIFPTYYAQQLGGDLESFSTQTLL